MKHFVRIAAAILAIVLVSADALASSTAAPVRGEPQRLKWRDGLIRVALSGSFNEQNAAIIYGTDIEGALQRSIAVWEAAAPVRFVVERTDAANVSPTGVAGDGVSLITIAPTAQNVLLFAKDPMGESARTRVFYNKAGFITEADIVLNPYQRFSTDGTLGTFDLEATLTHELGHLLGLRHSSVLGSVMATGLPRNTGSPVERLRAELAEADIAAIRDLYGFEDDARDCCGTITGRLTQPGKLQPTLKVWAEDNRTGRVAAQTETASDGSFRLGGLPQGTYMVLWQRNGGEEFSPVGQLGIHRIASGETKTVNERVEPQRSATGLSFIGLNDQLTDSAILIEADREYTVFVGGHAIEGRDIEIEFNSPYFRARPGSIRSFPVNENLTAVSFVLSVDPNAPRGVYSLFLSGGDNILAALIGGLKVQSPPAIQ